MFEESAGLLFERLIYKVNAFLRHFQGTGCTFHPILWSVQAFRWGSWVLLEIHFRRSQRVQLWTEKACTDQQWTTGRGQGNIVTTRAFGHLLPTVHLGKCCSFLARCWRWGGEFHWSSRCSCSHWLLEWWIVELFRSKLWRLRTCLELFQLLQRRQLVPKLKALAESWECRRGLKRTNFAVAG